jgi:hypothetical protein
MICTKATREASSMQTWTVDHAGLPSGDAMTHGTDATELLDVEMDEFARPLPLIAADRFGRLQGTELIEPAPS